MKTLPIVVALALCGILGDRARADIDVTGDGTFNLYGDFRLRWESDFDSRRPSGLEREDRDRVRLRARLGLKFRPDDALLFNIRLRTGNWRSQQSPHMTIWQDPGNAGDQDDVIVGRLWGKWTINESSSLIAGRNGLAIWKPNEIFWDDDVYVDGASFAHTHETEGGNWTFNAVLAALPDGDASQSLDERSTVAVGQVVFEKSLDEDALTLGQALLYIHDRRGEVNAVNDDLDFLISYTNFRYVFGADSDLPVTLGADLMINFKDGRSGDHPGDRLGFDIYANLGRLRKKGDVLAGYWFARIERWAVPRFMAQDDWFRWGSPTQTRSSDYYGHEVRFGYMLADNVNLLARFYVANAITSVEDGSRFRLDLNIKF